MAGCIAVTNLINRSIRRRGHFNRPLTRPRSGPLNRSTGPGPELVAVCPLTLFPNHARRRCGGYAWPRRRWCGQSVEQTARLRGAESDREVWFWSRLFRRCLDVLARVFGFATSTYRPRSNGHAEQDPAEDSGRQATESELDDSGAKVGAGKRERMMRSAGLQCCTTAA